MSARIFKHRGLHKALHRKFSSVQRLYRIFMCSIFTKTTMMLEQICIWYFDEQLTINTHIKFYGCLVVLQLKLFPLRTVNWIIPVKTCGVLET